MGVDQFNIVPANAVIGEAEVLSRKQDEDIDRIDHGWRPNIPALLKQRDMLMPELRTEAERDYIIHEGEEGYPKKGLREKEFIVCKFSFAHLCHNWVYIVDLDRKKTLFRWNHAQWWAWLNLSDCMILVKGRRVGLTLFFEVLGFSEAYFVPHTRAMLLAHDWPTTTVVYQRLQDLIEWLPPFLKPEIETWTNVKVRLKSNPYTPMLRSEYRTASAGTPTVGHGMDVDFLHLSEFALYKNAPKIMRGVQLARRNNAKIILESTGDPETEFQYQVKEARTNQSEFRLVFLPWDIKPENSEKPSKHPNLFYDDEVNAMAESYDLTDGQRCWYQLAKNVQRHEIWTQHPTTLDDAFFAVKNPFYDVRLLRQVRAQAAAYGVHTRQHKDPIWVNKRMFDRHGHEIGGVYVFERPKPGWQYRAGADCAEGLETSDDSALVILDADTKTQVCVAHGKWDVNEFARIIWEMTWWYGNGTARGCPVCVELNNHGHSVLENLRRLLMDKTAWGKEQERIYLMTLLPPNLKKKHHKPGCEQTNRMRTWLFDMSRIRVEKGQVELRHVPTIEQFIHMEYDPVRKRVDHPKGGNDDLVIAQLIAQEACFQPGYEWAPPSAQIDPKLSLMEQHIRRAEEFEERMDYADRQRRKRSRDPVMRQFRSARIGARHMLRRGR